MGSTYKVLWADDEFDALGVMRENEVELLVLNASISYSQELIYSILAGNYVDHKRVGIIMTIPPQLATKQVDFYKMGVDTCLIEPVDLNLLEACIVSLFRKQTQQLKPDHILKEQCIYVTSDKNLSANEELLKKAAAYIETKLSDTSVNPEEIAEYLSISPSTLYRRIKALTGISIGEFIRNVRLKNVARLLICQTDKIADIARSVGFSDPKYMRRLFREMVWHVAE